MKIAGIYSFAGGKDYVTSNHAEKLKEIEEAINQIDASRALVMIE